MCPKSHLLHLLDAKVTNVASVQIVLMAVRYVFNNAKFAIGSCLGADQNRQIVYNFTHLFPIKGYTIWPRDISLSGFLTKLCPFTDFRNKAERQPPYAGSCFLIRRSFHWEKSVYRIDVRAGRRRVGRRLTVLTTFQSALFVFANTKHSHTMCNTHSASEERMPDVCVGICRVAEIL